MADKPRLAIDIYNQYVRKDDSVEWPDDPHEQALIARARHGREIIANFDFWIKQAVDFLDRSDSQKPFPRKNVPYLIDKYYRERLKTLNTDQKRAVRNLLIMMASGILFSDLVALDQTPDGEYDLILKRSKGKYKHEISLFNDLPDELHDELNDWIVSFSEYSGEMIEFIQRSDGHWQFRPVEYYKEKSTTNRRDS